MEIPKIVRDYVDLFTFDTIDAWTATFGPDGTYCSANVPKPTLGRDLKAHFMPYYIAFPDITFETVGLYALSESLFVWRWIGRGTQTGPFRDHPATGCKIEMPGCEFIEIRDGRVSHVQGYTDRLTVLTQIGLVPAPQPHAETY
jgi:steroid delta-isomerase-like uncharacterized protein